MQFDFEAHKPILLKALKAVDVTPKHIEVLPQDDAMEIVVDNFGLMWIEDNTEPGDPPVTEFTTGYVAHIDGSYWEPPDEDPVYDQDSTTRSWAEACRLLALIFANSAIEAALEDPVYDQDSTTRSWAEACRLLAPIFANSAIEAALEDPE